MLHRQTVEWMQAKQQYRYLQLYKIASSQIHQVQFKLTKETAYPRNKTLLDDSGVLVDAHDDCHWVLSCHLIPSRGNFEHILQVTHPFEIYISSGSASISTSGIGV